MVMETQVSSDELPGVFAVAFGEQRNFRLSSVSEVLKIAVHRNCVGFAASRCELDWFKAGLALRCTVTISGSQSGMVLSIGCRG